MVASNFTSYGLVRASFQPDPCIAKLRAYFSGQKGCFGALCRSSLSTHAEALMQNEILQLHHVVKDITVMTAADH